MKFERLAAAILAAGSAARFGGDKLARKLGEFSVLEHVARSIAISGAPLKFCVTNTDGEKHGAMLAQYGVQQIINDAPELGMSRSIVLAVEAAERSRADGLLIALGDMPLVPGRHFASLIASAEGAPNAMSCTSIEGRRMPPALFPAALFEDLKALSGDRGAHEILNRIGDDACKSLAPEYGLDIDTQKDLITAQKILGREENQS